MDFTSWPLRRRMLACGAVVAVLAGITVWAGYRNGWWGCVRADSQARALQAYAADPTFALAPPNAILVRESTLTGPCVPGSSQTKEDRPTPEFALAFREYDVPRPYARSELTTLFDSTARAAGWRPVGDESNGTSQVVYCRSIDGTVTWLGVGSTTGDGGASVLVAIDGRPGTPQC
ncbi:hypothetical protein AB0I61_17690 [Polymorphospora rubra]|uniref:hypothetical protein n=1 Tax=Polymorphospora rubra TaxID=338584 RepID=UPI0033D931BF